MEKVKTDANIGVAARARPGRPQRGAAAAVNEGATENRASGKVVGAVAGAIRILRYLGEAREPVGVSRIARDTRMNTSTTFNILRTLALDDIVTFDPETKSYTLSLGIMEIAKGATALAGDIGAARPLMERIADSHGVTVTLWQPVSQDRKVLVLSATNRGALSIQMAVGQRLPLYIGATGRVFAAFGDLDDTELRQKFDEIRWQHPLSFSEFRKQVKHTRETGWARDDGNFAVGTVSLAVPVLDAKDTAVMAVTATMFTGRYSEDLEAPVVADLQRFAARVAQIIAG